VTERSPAAEGFHAQPPQPEWPFPEVGIDFEHANAARIYDYLLGGAHNFAVDREQAASILAAQPDMARICRANRDFLSRAVTWCVREAGIEQFLDLGCGVPTVGNVHEIAQRINPQARIAYVDFEPVAVSHAREIIAGLGTVTVTAADLREPELVLDSPGVAGLLDFTRPVALLAVGVLHFVPDDLTPIFAGYRGRFAPGSAVVVSHGSDDWDDPELGATARAAADGYRDSATPATLRTRSQLEDLLSGLEIEPPGLVDITDWPAPAASGAAAATHTYAAVARRQS
jgi:trans-aconitate methyltransferase